MLDLCFVESQSNGFFLSSTFIKVHFEAKKKSLFLNKIKFYLFTTVQYFILDLK